MTQNSEEISHEAKRTVPALPRTDRDLQRGALRDLVQLATECAAQETEIETRLVSALQSADQALAKTTVTLTQKVESLRQGVQAKHDERLVGARGELDADRASIDLTYKSQKSHLAAEYEASEQVAKQKLDQAIWLAESVFEATQIQVRKEQAKSDEEYKDHLEKLGENEATAFQLLALYRQEKTFAAPGTTPVDASSVADDSATTFEKHRETIAKLLRRLEHLQAPRTFVGLRPYLLAIAALIAAAVFAQIKTGPPITDLKTITPQWQQIGYALAGTTVGLIILAVLLWMLAKSHIRKTYQPLRQAISDARRAAKSQHQQTHRALEAKYARATVKRDQEVKAAKEIAAPQLNRAARNRDASLAAVQQESSKQLTKSQTRADQSRAALDKWLSESFAELQKRFDHDANAAKQKHDDAITAAQREHDESESALLKRWNDGLKRIQTPIGVGAGNGRTPHDWNDPAWKSWSPPRDFASAVAFGQLRVDVEKIASLAPRSADTKLELPRTFSLPALLAFPKQASLLIQSDRAGRAGAMQALELVMTRLLTNLPAGRVRFTIFDAVSLGQNFAGFMHLADHDEALVGGRIWTAQEQFDQRLTDLTEHMETVIQKYLRNEFETIDDYNAQAGELAEPYRFLVIADFPINFSAESIQKLNSIASTGARCGVYTLVARDLRAPIPAGSHIDELIAHSINLVQDGDRFVWKDEVFEQFPLTIDDAPAEESLTEILNTVGRSAKDSNRVEVPFDTIAPKPDEIWTGDATSELRVPIGRTGATRSQLMKLGRGVAQHTLIAGKTGSGKSTLLHVLVTNLALWYTPDEVEFYLVDFKKGVEFKTYATHQLPHARAIAVESDREFGLSVLQRLDGELSRRGEMFRKLGVQDLAAYRETSGKKLPRTLLIIDEFQEFFSEDDKLAQDAALLTDRLVRQGRAFGVHVLLGSQTIGGAGSLNRSTLGQMAVRIALQTSEADSQLILGDNNSAARLLSRPGEAIYNDQGGLVEANSPFQISWLSDEEREGHLRRIHERAQKTGLFVPEPNVFEGNAPADIMKNRKLEAALAEKKQIATPLAWLGDPVAIKDPTAVPMRRQSGSNILIVGQQEEPAMSIMLSSMISLASQNDPKSASFFIFDGTPADSALAGTFDRIAPIIPQKIHNIEYRAVEETIDQLAKELKKRQESGDTNPPAIYIVIYGLQRYRALRKSEDSFSFGSDEDKKPKSDKQFVDLLREGPALGIHVITWADTPAAVDRTIDRASMREFDNRILFQMSANDSSNLIDSPAANKLGFHRALAYSEEQGVLEKFRPYAIPSKSWLEQVRAALAAKS